MSSFEPSSTHTSTDDHRFFPISEIPVQKSSKRPRLTMDDEFNNGMAEHSLTTINGNNVDKFTDKLFEQGLLECLSSAQTHFNLNHALDNIAFMETYNIENNFRPDWPTSQTHSTAPLREEIWPPRDFNFLPLVDELDRLPTQHSNAAALPLRRTKRKRGLDISEFDHQTQAPVNNYLLFGPSKPFTIPDTSNIDYSQTATVNPFIDDTSYTTHTRATAVSRRIRRRPGNATNGIIDGLIKIRLVPKTVCGNTATQEPVDDENRNKKNHQSFWWLPLSGKEKEALNYLPADFGQGMKLETGDLSLLKFYIHGICSGRTLIPSSNPYLRDIVSIADKCECVKHALLALSASYVLDFVDERFTTDLTKRADSHHKSAVRLLDAELKNQDTYIPGKEDAALAALILLSHDDIVNWVTPRGNLHNPKWRRGIKTAKIILDKSDPGRRYDKLASVQSTLARCSLQNYIAQFDVLSSTVAPLPLPDINKCAPHPYLLEGSTRDITKIEGATGMCSRLLYIYSQITWLSSHLPIAPTSTAHREIGKLILIDLDNLRQWSELSEAYPNVRTMLSRCNLDENGLVKTAREATELHAESYIQAAKIYLHCRVFKKPRSHKAVQRCLRLLLECLKRCPTKGPLMTAQSPFFCTFIAGLVAVNTKDKETVRRWFKGCIAGPRGCVPPAWNILQRVWEKFDKDSVIKVSLSDGKSSSKDPHSWWENMVDFIFQDNGPLALA